MRRKAKPGLSCWTRSKADKINDKNSGRASALPLFVFYDRISECRPQCGFMRGTFQHDLRAGDFLAGFVNRIGLVEIGLARKQRVSQRHAACGLIPRPDPVEVTEFHCLDLDLPLRQFHKKVVVPFEAVLLLETQSLRRIENRIEAIVLPGLVELVCGDPACLPIGRRNPVARTVAVETGCDDVGLRIATAIGAAFQMFRRAFEALQIGDRVGLMAALDIDARHGVVLRLERLLPHGPLAIETAAVLPIVSVDAFFAEAHAVSVPVHISMPQRCMPLPKGKLE